MTPPPALKITDARTSHLKTPAHHGLYGGEVGNNPGLRQQAQHQPLMGTLPAYPFPYPPPMFPPYYPYTLSPGPSHWASPIPSHQQRHLPLASSSPPEVQTEDISIFPQSVDWLKSLDDGPHGVDNRNFVQYAQNFTDEEFLQVCDITDLSTAEILQICPTMTTGTAHKIADYAQQDTTTIRSDKSTSKVTGSSLD